MWGEKGLLRECSEGEGFVGRSVLRLPALHIPPLPSQLPLLFTASLPALRAGQGQRSIRAPLGPSPFPNAHTSCRHVLPHGSEPQTPHAGHSFRFLCVLGKGDFTLEDDTYSLRYTPVAATHPVCASNYCYLHVPREYVGDGKHKQSQTAELQRAEKLLHNELIAHALLSHPNPFMGT